LLALKESFCDRKREWGNTQYYDALNLLEIQRGKSEEIAKREFEKGRIRIRNGSVFVGPFNSALQAAGGGEEENVGRRKGRWAMTWARSK